MEALKIKVIIPTLGFPRFRVSNPQTNRMSYRKTIRGVWKLLARHFIAVGEAGPRHKTAVLVEYGGRCHNETCDSSNPAYLGFTTKCFLEDCLKPTMKSRLEKKYPPTDEI